MSDSIAVRVRYFAAARDAAGLSEETLTLEASATVATLASTVMERHPALVPWRRALRYAVDGEYARGDATLSDGVEVAVIPPVAGG